MASIPQNLIYLHEGEEETRRKNIAAVEADADLLLDLDMIERAMDLIDVFVRQQVEADADGRAVQHLAIRMFNGLATAWKLTASGYYQNAALILRDLIETVYLVNFFHIKPQSIANWRSADRKQLQKEFGPSIIRKALDDDDGKGKSKREQIYYMFSNLAGHPTKAGFDMLKPKGQDAIIGPFPDDTALRALVQELGSLAVQCGLATAVWLDYDVPMVNPTTLRFLQRMMDFTERFHGKQYSAAERAEINEIYATKR